MSEQTIMTESVAATHGGNCDRSLTRTLVAYGVIAGPVYVLVSLAQALTRDGFDLTRHAWSLLSNGGLRGVPPVPRRGTPGLGHVLPGHLGAVPRRLRLCRHRCGQLLEHPGLHRGGRRGLGLGFGARPAPVPPGRRVTANFEMSVTR